MRQPIDEYLEDPKVRELILAGAGLAGAVAAEQSTAVREGNAAVAASFNALLSRWERAYAAMWETKA